MLTFLSAGLVTGEVYEELPLRIGDKLSRFMMDVGSGSVDLPIRDTACPPDWIDHTTPWRVLFVAVDERARVIWAGIPTRRIRNPLTHVVQMPCVTVEGYLRQRHVPNMSFSNADQTGDITRALAGIAGDAHGVGLEFDTPFSGVNRDRDYHADEGGTVLARLQELSQVIDGFEWTIDVNWADGSQTAFTKTFRTGYPHLGRVTNAPDPVFEMPGGLVSFTFEESWNDDDAGTHVIATGDGEGESKTISTPVIDTVREGAGWPRLEVRRSFSSVTRQDTINSHAQSVAAETFGGTELITLESRTDAAPEFGEWGLGDSVRIEIDTDELRMEQIMRVVGWNLSHAEGTVEPVVARIRTPMDEDWIWE